MNIGIDIGGSHIAIGVVNEKNEMILKEEHNWTNEEKENFTDSILFYCKAMIHNIIQKEKIQIQKIGIGYPHKNIIDGVIYLKDTTFYLAKILSDAFQIPVYLKNDVKCSAFCEKKLGNLKNYSNCIFMALGTGIGGAYFYKNELVTPSKYQGFEIGHMIIQAVGGKKCRCGKNGCYEEYASMRTFRGAIEALLGIEKLTSDKMFQILESKQKEKEIQQIIDNYLDDVAIGINNIINIFEPDAICIGGSFTYYAPVFMEKLKAKVQKCFEGREIPELLTAQYENDAGMIGASMLESN